MADFRAVNDIPNPFSLGPPYEVPENPTYDDTTLQSVTTQTPVHADVINPMILHLLTNGAAAKKNADGHIAASSLHLTTYVHTKSASVHTLTGKAGGLITFKATAGFITGDTFKVNGAVTAVKTLDNQILSGGCFASGSWVIGVPDGSSLRLLCFSAAAQEETEKAVQELSSALNTLQSAINVHTDNKNNPHGATAAQVGAVPTTRTVNGKPLSANVTLAAADVGAVPTARTVNGKPLSTNVALTAADVKARPDTWMPTAANVGAVPITRTVNGKPLSANVTLAAADVGAVPTTRTVNGKPLSANVTLAAADVGAVPTARTVNGKPLSANVALTAADVGAVPKSGGSMTGTLTAGGTQVIGTAQVRNIYAGTADLTAGTSSLATGAIYFVYE